MLTLSQPFTINADLLEATKPARTLTEAEYLWIFNEWDHCADDYNYFIDTYCKIYDSVSKRWINFDLWDFQREYLRLIHENQFFITLKPRQIGATWMALCYELWTMLFHPIAECLNFSMREDEAIELISEKRLRGIYNRLPFWMHAKFIDIDAKKNWKLSNESSARAFATGTGDSYTATFALVDEADLIDDLAGMLEDRIMPTVEAGGKLVMISRVNKMTTESAFKTIYKEARAGNNSWASLFIPWYAHPLRTPEWYAEKVRNATHIDRIHGQYPATEEEALQRGEIGRVYPKFQYRENVSTDADYDPAYPVFWAVDDGYIDPRVILFVQFRSFRGQPDHVCIFNEYVVTQEVAATSIANAREIAEPAQIYFDPSAVEFAGNCHQVGLGTWGAYNKVEEGINVVRRFILDGNGKRLLQIHPRCETLIDALSNYAYKENTEILKPFHDEYSHPADALRYYIATVHL